MPCRSVAVESDSPSRRRAYAVTRAVAITLEVMSPPSCERQGEAGLEQLLDGLDRLLVLGREELAHSASPARRRRRAVTASPER